MIYQPALFKALDAVCSKAELLAEHDLTEPVLLLSQWAAGYHLAEIKAAAPVVHPNNPAQLMPVQNEAPNPAAQTALIAAFVQAFEALFAAQKVVLGNGR